MNLPKISDLEVAGKRVLVRMDLDLPAGAGVPDFTRLEVAAETLDYLKSKNAEIVVIGHRGRPTGDKERDRELSLKPFQPFFDKWGAKLQENLRFDPGEEANDPEFAEKLASMGDVYINESFANSHRNHASIVGLPKLLPHAMGLRFEKEIEKLSQEFKKPIIVIISGIKKDKVEMAKKLSVIYDKILVGGRLPEFFGDGALASVRTQNSNMIIGNLTMDKEDITLNTVKRFEIEIEKAGTIVLAGVLGKYEDEGHRQGTKEIFEAVAASSAYKIAGGGDTEAALTIFNLTDKFNWISVGGGAMLEFLASKTLPGIQALVE